MKAFLSLSRKWAPTRNPTGSARMNKRPQNLPASAWAARFASDFIDRSVRSQWLNQSPEIRLKFMGFPGTRDGVPVKCGLCGSAMLLFGGLKWILLASRASRIQNTCFCPIQHTSVFYSCYRFQVMVRTNDDSQLLNSLIPSFVSYRYLINTHLNNVLYRFAGLTSPT